MGYFKVLLVYIFAEIEANRYEATRFGSAVPYGQSCLSLMTSLHTPISQQQLLGHPRRQIPYDRKHRFISILGKLPLARSEVEFANSLDYTVDLRCGSCIIGYVKYVTPSRVSACYYAEQSSSYDSWGERRG